METNKKKSIKYNGVKAMPFVIGNESFEKLGGCGATTNLLVYLTTVFHLKSITAANVNSIVSGSANFGTLLGAFLSDTYFGRYNILAFASILSFLGMVGLTLTAVIPDLHPLKCEANVPNCNIQPTSGQWAFLVGSLTLLIMGAWGIRPCNLAFGADQFDPDTESGKRGITSFFNWYYFTYTFAVMISGTVVVYIQSKNWGLGLAIPAFFMFISCALFFVGTKIYVMVEPQGSPLTSLAQVIVAAFRKRQLDLPKEYSSHPLLFDYVPDESINSKLPSSDQFRFLDKAAIITKEDSFNPEGSAVNPWKLCSIQQVEQLKCLLRVFPIWVAGIIYGVSVSVMGNFVVFQALQSNRHFGTLEFVIPAPTYSIFTMLTISLWLPLYDRIIMPKLQKITGKENGITPLQKIGVGIFLLIITLIVLALVERSRRILGLTRPIPRLQARGGAVSSLSGFWLLGPLALAGLSEAFSAVALNEFFYNQFPENMRSFGGAFQFCGMAMSSYLSSFLQSAVNKMLKWLPDDLNKGRLDYFYYLLAGLEFVNLLYFMVCAKWYRYRETGDNNPPDGKIIEENKSGTVYV